MGYNPRNASETAFYAARHSARQKKSGPGAMRPKADVIEEIFEGVGLESDGESYDVAYVDRVDKYEMKRGELVPVDMTRATFVHTDYEINKMWGMLRDYDWATFPVIRLVDIFRINTAEQWDVMKAHITILQRRNMISCYMAEENKEWHVTGSMNPPANHDFEFMWCEGYTGVPMLDRDIRRLKIDREWDEMVWEWKWRCREWIKKLVLKKQRTMLRKKLRHLIGSTKQR